MPKLSCKLISHSVGQHEQQIYTGFLMLHRRGLVDLTQEIIAFGKVAGGGGHARRLGPAQVRVLLNNNLTLHYDLHDSEKIDEVLLADADYYFKRSFSGSYVQNLGSDRKKVYPLGLNYPIYPSGLDKHGIARSWAQTGSRARIGALVRSISLLDKLKFTPRVPAMESIPDYWASPRVLFMARAHDPYVRRGRQMKRPEETERLNDTRAETIRMLKNKLGSRFYGGFVHGEFASKYYSGLLVPDNTRSSRKNYLNLVKSYPICVATSGHHGSTGWKFGEYVALSKAILSERLNFEVPGDFAVGRNYLEFSSPSECAEKAALLCSDRTLRINIMSNNARYYQACLKPDSLVLNTLLTALSRN